MVRGLLNPVLERKRVVRDVFTF